MIVPGLQQTGRQLVIRIARFGTLVDAIEARDPSEVLGEHMANHGNAEHDLSELRSFSSSENGRGEMKFKDYVCVGGRLRILL